MFSCRECTTLHECLREVEWHKLCQCHRYKKNIISGEKVEGHNNVTVKWWGKTYAATIANLGEY